MLWTEKYRPKKIEDVIGNEEAKQEVVKWLIGWFTGNKEYPGVLLAGPPGIGKTSFVYALANQFNLHVVELNASDVRTAQHIYAKVGSIGGASTLDAFTGSGPRRNILLFFDEVDGIDPKADTGGLSAILDIANKKEVPIIAAANFPDPVKHKDLLNTFKYITFRPLTPRQIIILLKRIAANEGIAVSDELLNNIATKVNGDARLAVNLLQEASHGLDIDITLTPMENLPFEELIRRLTNSYNINEIRNLLNSNSNQIEDVFYTYYDLITRSNNTSFEDKVRLLDYCIKLNEMFGRMNKKRSFYLFRYILTLMPWFIYSANRAGIVYDGRIPAYRFKLFIQNRKYRDHLNEVYTDRLKMILHESYRKFVTETLPTIKFIDIKDEILEDLLTKVI